MHRLQKFTTKNVMVPNSFLSVLLNSFHIYVFFSYESGLLRVSNSAIEIMKIKSSSLQKSTFEVVKKFIKTSFEIKLQNQGGAGT